MSVQTEATDQRQAAVYRLYDSAGTLLYIGSSYNPERRYRDHHPKSWWPQVARRVEEWHPSKADAYAAELKAIAAEDPVHNHMGTPQYVPPSEKAAARRSHIEGELTVKGIMAKYGISRQSLHTYRQRPDFPLPVSRPGTGGLRWREVEVGVWFQANPPQQGKRTDLAPQPDQGEPVTTTTDPRIAILSDLNDPPYNEIAEKRCVPWDEAVKMLAAYREAVVTEVVDVLTAKGAELSELAEEEMRPSIEERAQTWFEAATVAEKLKRAPKEASDA